MVTALPTKISKQNGHHDFKKEEFLGSTKNLIFSDFTFQSSPQIRTSALTCRKVWFVAKPQFSAD